VLQALAAFRNDLIQAETMSSASATTKRPDKARPRGRPNKTEADQAEIRNRILKATAEVYAETGYHGLSVKLILEKANLSRPTFYRQFSNVEEPLRLVIVAAHQGLIDSLRTEIPANASIEDKMERAVGLYLKWGKNIGPLLRPMYIELHDPLSPASELRQQVLHRMGELYTKALEKNGSRLHSPLMTDLMVTGIEFLGYRYHLEQKSGKITLGMIKEVMLKLMHCTVLPPKTVPTQKKIRGAARKH
jgi:TetR/AcrR family transcriptional regulator